CDNFNGGRIAGEHLVGLGRRRIAFLGGASSHCPEFFDRFRGCDAALREVGGAMEAILQVDAESSEEDGYAALMGVAKEPGLYRCAVGYVGVYDLQERREDLGDSARWLGTFADEWMGDDEATLAQRSPTRIADRIKVPVFLAAGGKDKIAPIDHSRKMEKALKAAGTPVETLYFPTEGHGFYTEEHRREFYTRLLDFLSRNIGGQKADAKAGASATAR
ncbi:MAG TPA: prolyl oligopeptidase family serine peptidase, partial [Lysobacter sp.]